MVHDQAFPGQQHVQAAVAEPTALRGELPQPYPDRLIVGSPDDCLEQLQRWQEEIRPDYLIMRFRQPGGPSHQKTLEAIRLFGEKVIPKL